jgi:hypothetical protein
VKDHVTIATITYWLAPAGPGDDGVPYLLADAILWAVIARPSRTPEQVAGWITAGLRRRGDKTGHGRYECFVGVDIQHLTGPDLAYLRNVRWPALTGLPLVARAYHDWLVTDGGRLPPRSAGSGRP